MLRKSHLCEKTEREREKERAGLQESRVRVNKGGVSQQGQILQKIPLKGAMRSPGSVAEGVTWVLRKVRLRAAAAEASLGVREKMEGTSVQRWQTEHFHFLSLS